VIEIEDERRAQVRNRERIFKRDWTADATGTQASRLPDIAASADVSLCLVES
jgi:hypothetical protein